MEKSTEVENVIQKFEFFHNGEKLLITDFVENYDEVLKLFSKTNKQNKYALSSSFVLANLINGKYDVFVHEKKYDKWGLRVKKITFFNSLYDFEYNDNIDENKWEILFNLSIDAGSCLFFSDTVLENCDKLNNFLEKWMSCNFKGNLLKIDVDNQLVGFGTSSGYGDGLYEFKVYKDSDNVIGLQVDFIDDNQQQEYYDDSVDNSDEDNEEESDEDESDEDESDEEQYNSEEYKKGNVEANL